MMVGITRPTTKPQNIEQGILNVEKDFVSLVAKICALSCRVGCTRRYKLLSIKTNLQY
jgi:hypothetical protein